MRYFRTSRLKTCGQHSKALKIPLRGPQAYDRPYFRETLLHFRLFVKLGAPSRLRGLGLGLGFEFAGCIQTRFFAFLTTDNLRFSASPGELKITTALPAGKLVMFEL